MIGSELLNEDGREKKMQEIADEVPCAWSTLFEWKAQEAFGVYVNYLADKQLESMRSEVNVGIMKLKRGGTNGIPSVKALDLYMRRWGLLTDRTIVEDSRDHVEKRRKTDDEIRQELAELDEMVNGN